MIRLIIIAIAILLLWVILRSGWDRDRKILFAAIAGVLFGLGVWFEQRGEKPKEGLVTAEQIEICELNVIHSYRSNFDVYLCLKNTDEKATVKRLTLQVLAQKCVDDNCETVDTAEKELPVSIPPIQQMVITESLRFDQVDPATKEVNWKVNLLKLKSVL